MGRLVGTIGHLARMVVFVLVGVFLLKAAIEFDPKKAVGLDGALAKLAHQPYGSFPLGIVAAGLIAFAVYSATDARYRRIRPVGDRRSIGAKDALLERLALQVEHHEIAGYCTARAHAGELGDDDTARPLGATLEDASSADQLLTQIATGCLIRASVTEQARR